jgi:hypothetical protein
VGKQRRSKSGKDLPIGRPKKIFPRDKALALRAAGKSWSAIERELKVNSSIIRRALAA